MTGTKGQEEHKEAAGLLTGETTVEEEGEEEEEVVDEIDETQLFENKTRIILFLIELTAVNVIHFHVTERKKQKGPFSKQFCHF